MSKLNTIFFGTPEIAVPYLELTRAQTNLHLAVTQADKPRGRGMEILPCAVKKRAQELSVPVLSPVKLKDDFDKIAATPFDLGIVVAYGKIFRPDFLALPKLGLLNVHFSLLPQLRGAAPVQQALIQGYTQTGISIFWIRPGMDDGPLFLQKEIAIDPQDNAQTLFEKLIPLGITALQEVLAQLENGNVIQTPQTGTPTLAPMLTKEDALLRPDVLSAADFHNRVRGLACGPKPKIPFTRNEKTDWLTVGRTQPGPATCAAEPGTVLAVERGRGILVQCEKGCIWLCQLQPAGKKMMAAEDFAHGHNVTQGQLAFKE